MMPNQNYSLTEDVSILTPDVRLFNLSFHVSKSYNVYEIEMYYISFLKIVLGERWQYSVVPLNPVKSTSTDWSSSDNYPYYGMGAYGYATSGGTFFDTRSSPTGDTAWNN